MHSMLIHRHLWWFIFLAYLHVLALSLSSWKYRSRGASLEDWLGDSRSTMNNKSEVNDSMYVQTSTYSSPLNDSVSCENLEGVGSFNTTCLLSSTFYLNSDLYIYGTGNLEILPSVLISCPIDGCVITFNMSGNVKVGQHASIVAGTVVLSAANLSMEYSSSVNTSALGGPPPSPSSGTPVGYDKAGGGHGGRGASCLKSNHTKFWGGDVYAWSTLSAPWSYGSKGSGPSSEKPYGGKGGGRIKLLVKDTLYLNGSVTAEGGDAGPEGGGGSGGSIFVYAIKLRVQYWLP